MKYAAIYTALMNRAINREANGGCIENMERHHILPTAEGGEDVPGNIVYLTVREHFLAHLILARFMPNQIFSVEAILNDTTNRHRRLRFKHPKLRWKKWIRRQIARRRAAIQRDKRKVAALGILHFPGPGQSSATYWNDQRHSF